MQVNPKSSKSINQEILSVTSEEISTLDFKRPPTFPPKDYFVTFLVYMLFLQSFGLYFGSKISQLNNFFDE